MKNVLGFLALICFCFIISNNDCFSQMQSDSSDAVWSIVVPEAKSIDIDMKQCLVGDYKDSVISTFITNTGSWRIRIDTIYFSGTDADKFYLVSRICPFILEPGETRAAEFSFQPKSVGLKTAAIKIITQVDTLTQSIRGEGVQPTLSLMSDLVDFGKVEVLNRKDTLVYLLKNISSTPVSITSVSQLGPDMEQFEILNGGGFNLLAGETREMNLRFRPKYIGRTSGQIAFYYNGAGSPAVAQLFGIGIGGLVYIEDDSAYAGEKRRLRLVLANVNPDGLQGIAEKIRARIKFDKSILAPDITASYDFDNSFTYVNVGSNVGSSGILAEIPVTAGLGSISETSMDIEEFEFLDAGSNVVDMDVEKKSGIFKLLGICPEGGKRLLNPSGKVQILSIKPNPSSDIIDIEVELIESGHTKLYITDFLGKEKLVILDRSNNEFGTKNLKTDISSFGAGIYYIILQTPTSNQSAYIIKN